MQVEIKMSTIEEAIKEIEAGLYIDGKLSLGTKLTALAALKTLDQSDIRKEKS